MENIDMCYEIVLDVEILLTHMIAAWCYCYLIKPFMTNRKYLWTVGASYVAVMETLWVIPYSLSNFCAYFLGVAAGFTVMVLTDLKSGRLKILQKIFLVYTFFSVRWLVQSMSAGIEDIMSAVLTSLFVSDGIMTEYEGFWIFVCDVTMARIVSFATMFAAVWIIRKVYAYKDEELTKAEFVMLCVPLMSVALSYEVKKFYEYKYQSDVANGGIIDLYAGHNMAFSLYYMIMFAAIPAVIMMHGKIKRAQKNEYENERYIEQLDNMKQRISEIEGLYGDIRNLKHDIGNHIMTMECLYKRGAYEEAERYLISLKNSFNTLLTEVKSGNPVTDVILTQGQKQAQEKGIEFICDFHYPEGIDAFDLSIILSNAIANALEAALFCRNPFVKITSYRRENACMLEIKNSFEGSITYDEITGLPQTTKSDKKQHGFGLESIRKTARKYFGDIDISSGSGEFTLCVMMMIQ